MSNLRGKRALVTGGAVRLGRAMVEVLADEGAAVCIHCCSSRDAAEQAAESIRRRGGSAGVVSGDFSHPATAAPAVIQQAEELLGGLDILVNSAAIFEPETLDEVCEEQVDRHLAINLKGPLFLSQAFVATLAGQPGQIVNIVDWRALRPIPGHLIYTMTKAGLVALTRMLALELAPHVRVNAIAPGAILPPPGAGDHYQQLLARRVPLGRMGSPRDITDALLYLLRSEFVTGEVLTVTGGESL
jgi:pteridine reductase